MYHLLQIFKRIGAIVLLWIIGVLLYFTVIFLAITEIAPEKGNIVQHYIEAFFIAVIFGILNGIIEVFIFRQRFIRILWGSILSVLGVASRLTIHGACGIKRGANMKKRFRVDKADYECDITKDAQRCFTATIKWDGVTIHSKSEYDERKAINSLRERIRKYQRRKEQAGLEKEKMRLWNSGKETYGFLTKPGRFTARPESHD